MLEKLKYYGSFKPYYKWNTFNTIIKDVQEIMKGVGFKPYYKWNTFNTVLISVGRIMYDVVLNLIINGIPSIPALVLISGAAPVGCFKPYYKWNTFNTLDLYKDIEFMVN